MEIFKKLYGKTLGILVVISVGLVSLHLALYSMGILPKMKVGCGHSYVPTNPYTTLATTLVNFFLSGVLGLSIIFMIIGVWAFFSPVPKTSEKLQKKFAKDMFLKGALGALTISLLLILFNLYTQLYAIDYTNLSIPCLI